jgi:hypothetical protein
MKKFPAEIYVKFDEGDGRDDSFHLVLSGLDDDDEAYGEVAVYRRVAVGTVEQEAPRFVVKKRTHARAKKRKP